MNGTALRFTVTTRVTVINTATYVRFYYAKLSCLSSAFLCRLFQKTWEFGDGNSFSSVCLVKSVAGWGGSVLTTLGVLELFVFSFLSLFPSLVFFFSPSTNAQLQLFVSPPASCQLESLSVDILTQHLLPTGELGMCQKSWWQATLHLPSILVR